MKTVTSAYKVRSKSIAQFVNGCIGKLLLLKIGLIAVIVFTHILKSTKLVECLIAVMFFAKYLDPEVM